MTESADTADLLVEGLLWQSRACEALGSRFSGELLAHAAADTASGGPTRALMAPWEGADVARSIRDAVPLRLLGALHEQVLAGDAPALAVHYPTSVRPGDAEAAWREAAAIIERRFEAISAFMAHEPQTNETRRSVCLLGGFLTIAAETGLPIRQFELGASAGLNQLWDRYHYELVPAGGWGSPASPVRLDTEWRGDAPPLGASAQITERSACDRKPVDITDPAARLRLKAYIWPDQPERLARLDAAIAMALAAGTQVDAEDAVTWTQRRVGVRAGAVTVLFHSVFWVYLPEPSQAALGKAIANIGASASAQAPLAWLRMENPPGNPARMEVRLTLWPGGEERLLATCHPHGAWVEWLA